MNMTDIFNPKDIFKPQDKKELENQMKEAEKLIDVSADIARKCLSFEDFKSYRESYKRAEEGILDAMLSYTNSFVKESSGDTSRYAITIVRYLTRLQDLRSLLDVIDKNSKRGLKK